jgi:hypothetical protein
MIYYNAFRRYGFRYFLLQVLIEDDSEDLFSRGSAYNATPAPAAAAAHPPPPRDLPSSVSGLIIVSIFFGYTIEAFAVAAEPFRI